MEYRDFLSQALELPEQLRRTDPVGWLDTRVHLRAALQQPDDGSASFLLYSGQRILQAIERPVLLQVRLRNIFEMIFDNMDISMPHRQWEYLRTAYPDVAQQCDPIRLKEVTGSFRLSTVNGWNYYLTILSLYFAQETQRITRCVHCWEYFIPPTRKRTLYCDRRYDVEAMPLAVDTTVWQQRVAADMDHAPADSFPEQVMFLNLPTDGSPAQWEMKTRDQLRREAQKGHQSLRDKYTHKEKQS